jgi:hypothetical protein
MEMQKNKKFFLSQNEEEVDGYDVSASLSNITDNESSQVQCMQLC